MVRNEVSDSDRKTQPAAARVVFWGMLLVVLLTMLIRFALLGVPLERDEGEYAYGGQLILQGVLPYQQIYNMKLPGIYAAYAGLMALFGQTHTGIHLGLMFINAATIVLVFLLARQLHDPIAGVGAAAAFAVMSLLPSVQGLFANAEHFVILFSVGGLWVLVKALDENRHWLLLISGLMLGSCFLMKQHGAAFILLGGLYLLTEQIRNRPLHRRPLMLRIGLFAIGALVPYGITCLVFVLSGTFDKFWFWTYTYAKAYAAVAPLSVDWQLFIDRALAIVQSAPLIWLLALLGLPALGLDDHARRRLIFMGLFLGGSLVAISPGFYFRPHYFILLLPASAVLAGISISTLGNKLLTQRGLPVKYGLSLLLAGICVAATVYQHRQLLFNMTPFQLSRAVYGLNPFPETLEIAQFIRANTNENDRIAVLGSEPQIYFYAGRRSASGYVYMYALMENHDYALRMQKEMIQEIENAQPKFIVFVNVATSWLKTQLSHPLLQRWLKNYQYSHYNLVGLVSISQYDTHYQWAQGVKWPPDSPLWIAVLQRKI